MEREDIFQEDPSRRSPLALDQETLLNGQFRIGRVLGVGGFGITYLAFDEVLEMVVAVKEYLPSDIAVRKTDGDTIQPFSSSGDGKEDFEYGLERFLREARTLAKFERHPNIVRVRTFFQENGTAYLVMNFYQGLTLAEYLNARNGFIPEEEALLIMDQMLDGLGAVHEEGVLHRDIDPNNVYLADDGTVVLLDFGAARTAVGERTQSMSVVLKRGYAPHEQYHSHGDQGPWTDVYACSATLYRALTGYKPPEAAARILNDDLAEPAELVPSLSEATNDAIIEGLSIRPEQRPQSVAEFADLLPNLERARDEAEPGWVGEVTRTEPPPADTESAAELQVTATHACRLYVDGSLFAELPPDESFTLAVDPGSHRLRAVRTDRATTGNATVTAAESDLETEQGNRVSLQALMWQSAVSATEKEPTPVEIDFDEGVPGAGDSVGKTEMAGQTEVPGEVEGSGEEAPTEEIDSPAEGPTPPEPARLRVRTDRSARLFVDGDEKGRLDPNEEEELVLSLGDHRVRAEATDGPATWEEEVTAEAGSADALEIALDEAARSDGATGSSAFRYVGIGGGVLAVLLGVGWWVLLRNQAPEARPDRVLASTEPVVVDVLANDHDPDQDAMHLRSVASIADSVGHAEVVDSTRLRLRPAAGFAGVAHVPYVVADAAGDTARSHVELRVPFHGSPRIITERVKRPQDVHAATITEEGLDVAIAALSRRAVGWSQKARSEGTHFDPLSVLETSDDGAVDVHAADLTGNGRLDILSASLRADAVTWYENEGEGTFGAPQPIAPGVDGPVNVQTADVDGDGDADVIVGALLGERVLWYENQGSGRFGPGRVIVSGIRGLETLHVTDLDSDDTPDLLTVSYRDSVVNRYEPQSTSGDSVHFQVGPSISTPWGGPIEIHSADVTGDGSTDVILGLAGTPSVVLVPNQTDTTGTLTFGEGQVLETEVETAEGIDTGDVDGDGAPDVFAGSFDSDVVVWFENQGDGTFRSAQTLATDLPNVLSLEVADVNDDGAPDVVAASQANDLVAWYENHLQ